MRIELCLDGQCWSLDFDGGKLKIRRQAATSDNALHLTQQQFIQLCFAYPAAFVAAGGALANLSARI